MAIELYNDGNHRCLAFADLVAGDGVQANQFLIIDGKHEAILDPGGDLTFTALSTEVSKHIDLRKLDYLIASHQDPDIIASLSSWVSRTDARIVCSRLWARFLPHLLPGYMGQQVASRCLSLPDQGGDIPMGDTVIKAVPAHFLHSVGNFQFYDPVSKILFSGDMGASIVDEGPDKPVEDFAAHVPSMLGFHQRYMCSNKVCRLWANMVRDMDVEMIVPQHGRPFKGKAMVAQFLDWISGLECGVDLMTQENYKMP
ncbi:MAG: MBL fold metallo-hydrolase [Gammaproteobacteria bacterium]|nr:MBL fold metallo-hydrolase [Gammaproteobacteria bacterium]